MDLDIKNEEVVIKNKLVTIYANDEDFTKAVLNNDSITVNKDILYYSAITVGAILCNFQKVGKKIQVRVGGTYIDFKELEHFVNSPVGERDILKSIDTKGKITNPIIEESENYFIVQNSTGNCYAHSKKKYKKAKDIVYYKSRVFIESKNTFKIGSRWGYSTTHKDDFRTAMNYYYHILCYLREFYKIKL